MSFYAVDVTRPAVWWFHLSVNWDETHASPHFKLVSTNFNAFVHCSSELNWILTREKTLCLITRLQNSFLHWLPKERFTYFIENAPPVPLESWILPFSILNDKARMLIWENRADERKFQELSHGILSFFGLVQNHLQTEGNLKIIVY